MRRSRYNESDDFEVPQTPLIDIIFILIVFFLVATTFYTDERDLEIKLPEGTQGELIPQEEEKYVINVREGGVVVVKNELLTMDKLESELQAVAARDRAKVEIRGDTDARHGRIMAVMNLCKKCGITDYSLTQRIVKEVD